MNVETFDDPSPIGLTLSQSFTKTSLPSASTPSLTDSYILHIATLNNSYATSLSAPSNSIAIFDKSRLYPQATFKAHSDAITLIRSSSLLYDGASSSGGSTLLSSGKDGFIKVWDERRGSESVLKFATSDKRGVLSFDVSADGYTVAAGTELKGDDACMVFWDVRNASTPTHINPSAHSDDITATHFHPTISHLLLTSSADGLLCTTDAREQDDDESGINVGNWGCSVASVGWTDKGVGSGMASSRIWAHSDMQTLSLWSSELDKLHDYGDMRKPNLPERWTSEYFIDAMWLGDRNNLAYGSGLGIWAGANNGDVALLLAQDANSWKIERLLTGAHSDVVRCVHWDIQSSVLITGGEDSKLSMWNISGSDSSGHQDTEHQDMDMDVDEEAPRRISKRDRETIVEATMETDTADRPKKSRRK